MVLVACAALARSAAPATAPDMSARPNCRCVVVKRQGGSTIADSDGDDGA